MTVARRGRARQCAAALDVAAALRLAPSWSRHSEACRRTRPLCFRSIDEWPTAPRQRGQEAWPRVAPCKRGSAHHHRDSPRCCWRSHEGGRKRGMRVPPMCNQFLYPASAIAAHTRTRIRIQRNRQRKREKERAYTRTFGDEKQRLWRRRKKFWRFPRARSLRTPREPLLGPPKRYLIIVSGLRVTAI